MTGVGCVIPAAGKGERLGGPVSKALRDLGGAPLLEHAVRAIAACRAVTHIVVAAPEHLLEEFSSAIAGLDTVADLHVTAGGASRTSSVRLGLAALPAGIDTVLVHDAARPLVPPEVVESVVAALMSGAQAVVPVTRVVDTIKQIDAAGRVVSTLDRSALRSVQTPQGFRRDVLTEALLRARGERTDDAAHVEAIGVPVLVVPGHEDALKITRPIDLLTAEALLRRRMAARVN
ncbi:MAG: 2-C-methyl-D-erythritol 4-phosphate cytidylyltransferase [Candidatus Nanopelagicales bacterium]|nr:2-C-methyl-D-erythritol 4-phosphate cytidylyltransferase [Candidatus Nanopelagicales bacterium]